MTASFHSNLVKVDVVIIGAGIAGLWLLAQLRRDGFNAILLESHVIGGGQTIFSQGIIHSGIKYALNGMLSKTASSMANISSTWLSCLQGTGTIDLTSVSVLSKQHYLWSNKKLTNKLICLLAKTVLSQSIIPLARETYPTVFQSPDFTGELLALNEVVIDIPSLLQTLSDQYKHAIFKINPLQQQDLTFAADGTLKSIRIHHAELTATLQCQQWIFTAGAGNQFIARHVESPSYLTQVRPLHMVLMRLPRQELLYAHCLGIQTKPLLTITTHFSQQGESFWYIGGLLAEHTERSTREQILTTKQTLAKTLPWINLTGATFTTFKVNRYEPLCSNNNMPTSPVIKKSNNLIVAWPVKLSLTPKLTDMIKTHLQKVIPRENGVLLNWPVPSIATPLWDTVANRQVEHC